MAIIVHANASRILPKLYQGAFPRKGHFLSSCGIDVLVLCAEEHQPPTSDYPGVEVIRCPFWDTRETLERETLEMVFLTAERVARRHRAAKRVLVTCRLGLNRSGLVTGIAMTKITGCSGVEAVNWIRSHRENALSNPAFAQLLGRIGSSSLEPRA